MILLYTDGASKGNPGPGGYGVILKYKQHLKEISAGFRMTTNNRMELMAVIVGLEAISKEGMEIQVYSDSKYVVDAFDKGWVFGWMKKGFAKRKNPDLWMRVMKSYAKHQVKFIWIKGHSGHPQNERCDALAVAASEQEVLLHDTYFESQPKKLFD